MANPVEETRNQNPTMAKKPQKAAPVNLRFPAQYPYSCMANRYAVERHEGFTLAHFGLITKSGFLIDRLSLLFPDPSLEIQRESVVQYSDGIGAPKVEIPEWTPPALEPGSQSTALPVVDFLHLTNWGDAYAEICCWNYSQGLMAELSASKSKDPLVPWGVALIRCGLDLQRAFLIALYEENTE